HEPVGVAELTAHFGLNHNAIRQHLAKLRDAGLVLEETAEPSGPGRPSLRYRPNPGAADRWDGTSPYEELSMMLLEVLRGGEPREVGRTAGRRLAHAYGDEVDPAELLEAVTRRLGFEPTRVENISGAELILDRCPFAASAALAPDVVCELHRGLAEGVSAEADGIEINAMVVHPAHLGGCRVKLESPVTMQVRRLAATSAVRPA
ncbi:MAG: ArsR family transcriptional regulator, partial [Ilumatobacteraceae bacterium]